MTISCLLIAFLLLIRSASLTFDLGQWSHMASHVVNPSTKFENYGYPFLSYEFWHLALGTIDSAFSGTAHALYHV